MAGAKGWITVRGLPFFKVNKNLKMKDIFSSCLESFFKKNSVCEKCEGKGYTCATEPDHFDSAINVKYSDFEQLEKMKDCEEIHFGNKIKQILETELYGRKPCKLCNGSGFVAKK